MKRTERKRITREREREKTFNTEEHISHFTQYNMVVQPSIVIHWKTVSMANPMLSKLVMPEFGPSQRSRHIEVLALHTWAPNGCVMSLSVLHGLGCSPSFTITSATLGPVRYLVRRNESPACARIRMCLCMCVCRHTERESACLEAPWMIPWMNTRQFAHAFLIYIDENARDACIIRLAAFRSSLSERSMMTNVSENDRRVMTRDGE